MRLFLVSTLLTFGLLSAPATCAVPEFAERAAISASTRQAFADERFAELNEISQRYRIDKSRTASGLWRLTGFYGAISEEIHSQRDGQEREAAFRALEAKTARWAQQYPASPAAHIAHSMVLIDHGWAYRGEGYAASVDQQSWAPFHHYVAKARRYLEAHKTVAAVDPQWYGTMLTVARAEGWDRSRFDRLLAEALDREPLFYQTYFTALQYLLPKWQGRLGDVEAFAQDAIQRTSKWEGQGIYARIYWVASQTQFKNDLFGDSLASWPRMKAGFDDVIAKYPDAWNLNNYAKFACLARDKETARALLTRMGATIVHDAWTPPLLRTQCAAWALPWQPGQP